MNTYRFKLPGVAANRSRQTALGALAAAAVALMAGCQETAPATSETAAQPANIQAQKAVAGVGKRGQSLQDDTGVAKIVSGPAAVLFKVEQKAVLEFKIPPALQMFKATNGRFPNSHDEFMEKIVKANRITLPELPEGAVYRFNTEKGELWVYPEDQAPE